MAEVVRGPLEGITVVDCTAYLSGPYAAMMLADMGARVIKVEALEGDSFRELPGFYGWNRGKRSVAVNLKDPYGRAIVHRLAEPADVVMENMRPGVVERLGVDYATLRAVNPRIIYCSVTAFGSDGPYRDRPRLPGGAGRALRARADGQGPAGGDLAPPGRARAAVRQRRGLSRPPGRVPRHADLPALPGRRWRVVLPRLRQPVLLGQALRRA